MPDSFVQLPPDSTGKKYSSFQEVIGANTVETSAGDQRDGNSFWAVYDRVVPAANKYMATLFNTTSTRVVKVKRIWRCNWQVAAITSGTTNDQELRRISARTAGTAVTPLAMDTNDVLTAGITADHASTAVTEVSLYSRLMAITEEVLAAPATQAVSTPTTSLAMNVDWMLIYSDTLHTRALRLKQNQGITIKNIAGTLGSVSYIIEFLDDPV